MTPTLPDRRQPRPVEQQLVSEGDRVWDLAALASLTAGWDARAERRAVVERLSRRPGVDNLRGDGR